MIIRRDLETLASAGAISETSVAPVMDGDGFVMRLVKVDGSSDFYGTNKTKRRHFKTTDAAWKLALDVGIEQVLLKNQAVA